MGNDEKTWVGGARLDISNATWPFAKLTVSKEALNLDVKFFGKLTFRPDQITNIEAVGFLPFIGKGIQIHHTLDVLTKPTKVIFWHLSKDTKWLVEELAKWGYGKTC